jgi:hypothetical protein
LSSNRATLQPTNQYLVYFGQMLHRIELGDFLIIAEIHSGIDANQLARIPRAVSLAEAALGGSIRRLR